VKTEIELMEVLFFQPEPRVNARHEDSESAPNRPHSGWRSPASPRLLVRICLIVFIQLNLLLDFSYLLLCSRDSCVKE